MFISIDKYKVGTNPSLEYIPNEYISPVIIIDNIGNKLKINYNFWVALIDIHDGIIE